MRPKARTSNLVVQEASGETLIYDLENNKAFCLNETSSLVMKHCDGRLNLTEIAASISGKLDTPVTEEMVWLALSQLDREGLLKDFEDVGSTFNGMSRRDVVKKIGFGSMVALPIVSSIVAPRAANAQSATGAVLDQCGAGFPMCGGGLSCFVTSIRSVPNVSTSTGISQCCDSSGGSFVSGTFCAPSACSAIGCDNQPSIIAPTADPVCTTAGQVTCMYQ